MLRMAGSPVVNYAGFCPCEGCRMFRDYDLDRLRELVFLSP